VKRPKKITSQDKSCGSVKKLSRLTITLLILTVLMFGGIVYAYISTTTKPLENVFTPSSVSCEVSENFDKVQSIKSNVTVKNTSDIPAYVRIKLVTYRVNGSNERIGGSASIPSFTPGSGWFEKYGIYYYELPVDPNGGIPAHPLIGTPGITLDNYTDADGGKQVIEVMAEAIQSVPARAVTEAWGVSVGTDGSLSSGG
jgi:hypothetical protein